MMFKFSLISMDSILFPWVLEDLEEQEDPEEPYSKTVELFKILKN